MAKQITGYYVSVTHGDDYRLVSGPYRTKERAEAKVDTVRKYVVDNYADAIWYAYGVAKVTSEHLVPGCLDEQFHFEQVGID